MTRVIYFTSSKDIRENAHIIPETGVIKQKMMVLDGGLKQIDFYASLMNWPNLPTTLDTS